MNPNKRVIKNWVEALRSGQYKQGRSRLRRKNRFCCLGVLCDLHAKATGNNWDLSEGRYLNDTHFLPDEVVEWAGVDNSGRDYSAFINNLILLNDRTGTTFEQIADQIEKKFLNSI